ncbi:hypothetical protein V2W30_19130 [Streptomyces sp. Q6]|uniref:Uncharacterized protein n=1 Tax=Streptomyces citrinus TaxID=3118173 RepID=A0ACD5ADD6_9ACTN
MEHIAGRGRRLWTVAALLLIAVALSVGGFLVGRAGAEPRQRSAGVGTEDCAKLQDSAARLQAASDAKRGDSGQDENAWLTPLLTRAHLVERDSRCFTALERAAARTDLDLYAN